MRPYTSPAEREAAYTILFKTFKSGKTKSLAWRKWQLKQLWWMLEDNEPAIFAALKSDLSRHGMETYMGDLMGIKHDLLDHLEHLEAWAADEYVGDAGFLFGTLGRARIRKEPLGVGLIIGAWNFPFMLLLQPMIGAISAGCCVMLKPSELAVASQNLLQDLIPRYLDQSAIRLVTGGPHETTAILKREFNHIFYTGSTQVGRIVAEAAAKHLVPTVLELGGQCPAIVTKSANIDLAAKRIMYSKVMNAGQVCLAVNHVFADPDIYGQLLQRMVHWSDAFAADGHAALPRLINQKHVNRMQYLKQWTRGTVSPGDRACDDIVCTVPRVVGSVSIGGEMT
jgi:aldehyde dehydrogenase (NAD+)